MLYRSLIRRIRNSSTYINHHFYLSLEVTSFKSSVEKKNVLGEKPEIKAKIKKINKKKKSEINESISLLYSQYPKSVWDRHKQSKDVFIADVEIAREIATIVCENDREIITFEANPGPGILTEALLKAGIPKLCAFEKEETFVNHLKKLAVSYAGQLDVVEHDIINNLADLYLLCTKMEKKTWTDSISCKFIATVNSLRSINFIRHMFSKISTMSSFFSCGRCQFYLIMSSQEYNRIIAKPTENFENYRNSSVLYNLFFDIKYLKNFPVTQFLPQMRKSYKKKAVPNEHFHFVCLTPKVDLLEQIPQKKLPEFYFFVWHHMTKKKDPVIKTLEQWIPFCGPKFIKKGMHVFTRFGDLNPPQILNLFQQFSALPEYDSSPFRAAVRQTYEYTERKSKKI